jgi:hypothetical protein
MTRPDLYTALECSAFPCNPIPFANGLAEHVKDNGTDSIKSDQAKRILWILMSQAYGQLATIDLWDEWDRLTKRRYGNIGNGPDGRGNCFDYDCEAPPVDLSDGYECETCGRPITNQ